MQVNEILEWLKKSYEKLLFAVVLIVLLLSVSLLIILVDKEKSNLRSMINEQKQAPITSSIKSFDIEPVQNAIENCFSPFQITIRSNKFFIAEERIACISCGRPIPIGAKECPYFNCRAVQPEEATRPPADSDNDLMPDEYEKAHNLNPFIDDSKIDSDGDMFSNLEEYKQGTRPDDENDHPPYAISLKVLKIARLSLPLTFHSIIKTAEGEKFGLRNILTGKDIYLKLNDFVTIRSENGTEEKYQLIFYSNIVEQVVRGGVKLKEDKSKIILEYKGEKYKLTRGETSSQGPIYANLLFTLSGEAFVCKVGDTIQLNKKIHKIVDIKTNSVIVSDLSSGKEFNITLSPDEGQKEPAPSEDKNK
jgi:hypothetical protein